MFSVRFLQVKKFSTSVRTYRVIQMIDHFDDQNSYQLNHRFLCQIIHCQQRHLQCKRDKRKQMSMKIRI